MRVVDDLVGADSEMDEGLKYILLAIDDQRTIEEIALETHASEYYVCEAIYPRESGIDLPSSLDVAGAAACIRKQDLSRQALRDLWKTHGRERPS